jgi:hypothetical protein
MIIFYFVAGIFFLVSAFHLGKGKGNAPGTGCVAGIALLFGVAGICFGVLGVVHALLSR